jgi:alpha-beta hydrolase superfamily lysophospholipase
MATETGNMITTDGLSLYWKAWLPEGKPRAVVQVIHGYAEHIDRYRFVVDELVPAGFAVFGHRPPGTRQERRKTGLHKQFRRIYQ